MSIVPTPIRTDVPISGASTIPALAARQGRFSCWKCHSRWSGQNVAHCGVCCETFGGVSGFDTHRVGKYDHPTDPRRCAHPSTVGLVITSRGTWGTSGDGVDFADVFGGDES